MSYLCPMYVNLCPTVISVSGFAFVSDPNFGYIWVTRKANLAVNFPKKKEEKKKMERYSECGFPHLCEPRLCEPEAVNEERLHTVFDKPGGLGKVTPVSSHYETCAPCHRWCLYKMKMRSPLIGKALIRHNTQYGSRSSTCPFNPSLKWG